MQLTEIPGDIPACRAFVSRCGLVTGVVTVADTGVGILEWQSRARGHTRAALSELKAMFPVVAAIGIGSHPSDPSWQYWVHMAKSGLVDQLEDDDGNAVPVAVVAARAEVPAAPVTPTPRAPDSGMEP